MVLSLESSGATKNAQAQGSSLGFLHPELPYVPGIFFSGQLWDNIIKSINAIPFFFGVTVHLVRDGYRCGVDLRIILYRGSICLGLQDRAWCLKKVVAPENSLAKQRVK